MVTGYRPGKHVYQKQKQIRGWVRRVFLLHRTAERNGRIRHVCNVRYGTFFFFFFHVLALLHIHSYEIQPTPAG